MQAYILCLLQDKLRAMKQNAEAQESHLRQQIQELKNLVALQRNERCASQLKTLIKCQVAEEVPPSLTHSLVKTCASSLVGNTGGQTPGSTWQKLSDVSKPGEVYCLNLSQASK